MIILTTYARNRLIQLSFPTIVHHTPGLGFYPGIPKREKGTPGRKCDYSKKRGEGRDGD